MQEVLKSGFTTGSCAAAAAKAAVYMLLTKEKIEYVSILTPAGITYTPELFNVTVKGGEVTCGVKKDAGDDPDMTNGMLICAKVTLTDAAGEVEISAGEGIGVVTRPGLNQPVGNPAINSTPREMIVKSCREAMDEAHYEGGVAVCIFAPEGVEIGKRTFNPHMGIEGGISILGTSGIVKPMSKKALTDTIRLDLAVKRAEGDEHVIIVPGNYGTDFLQNTYGINPDKLVHSSNFIGETLDMAIELGFKHLIFAGHTGKFVKLSGGIMNTHSHEADSRAELMLAGYIRAKLKRNEKIEPEICRQILDSVSTTAALEIIGGDKEFMNDFSALMVNEIIKHLNRRANNPDIKIDVILYESSYGLLAKSISDDELM